jgi:hypothetical protein
MSETTTTTDNVDDKLPTPVLPGSEKGMVQPEEVEMKPVAAPPPSPKRGRGRPSNKDKDAPRMLTEAESDKWDYDSWIMSFDWDQPNMQCKVERIAPEMVGTVLTAGVCGVFDNMPLTTQQIQQQFGGGRYHVSVIGPRDTKKGVRIQRLGHKPLKIPGDPNLENLGRIGMTSAEIAQQRAPQSSSQSGSGSDPGMVRLIDNMTGHLQRRVDQSSIQSAQQMGLVGQQFQDAASMKIQAANDMLAEKDRLVQQQMRAADAKVEEERRRADIAHAERDKAIAEAKAAQERIYEERRIMEDQFSKKLQGVQGDSTNLISTLIPTIQTQAQNQINTMMTVFQGQVASQDANYTSRLEGLERSYEQRMRAQEALFKTQMESAGVLYQGQIQHLQVMLTAAQEEKKLLQTQLDDSRNRLMEQISKINKASDPEEQLVKLGGLLETVKGITGLGGGDDEEKVTSGNPMFDMIMNNVGKITEVVPHIAQAVAAKAQADMSQPQQQQMQQQQMMQQQMMQQQAAAQAAAQAAPQLQAPQQHPQAQPQQAQPQQAQPPPQRVVRRPKGKIDRDEIDKAISYINSAMGSNPDIDPRDFANMAIASIDNNMLRRISRQKSELVVDELETKGILHGAVSTENGKVWLCQLLDVMREKL